jgi:hypothetical protein
MCESEDWLAGAPGFEPGNGGIKIQTSSTKSELVLKKLENSTSIISIG